MTLQRVFVSAEIDGKLRAPFRTSRTQSQFTLPTGIMPFIRGTGATR